MPNTMSVYEAKSKFSGILQDVVENHTIFTIVRYGIPIAKIVPIERKKHRVIEPLPGCADKIKINCDLFADDSSLWEAAQ